MSIKKFFYLAKPLIPRRLQVAARRRLMRRVRTKNAHIWPIHPDSAQKPSNWQGWPNGKKFSVVLTHDVELAGGHDKCTALMQLEQQQGFVSSFNFVPERYEVSPTLRSTLNAAGFEVGVHGLNHDGKLFSSREEFSRRAVKINQYIKDWKADGFRAPAMHHNLDWIRDLNIEYDASTFDTDPFEPQPDGECTIFPFMVPDDGDRSGYVELPYTLPQDFTLFVILQEKEPNIWKRKVDWIAERGGMVLVNVHPDYINFENGQTGNEEFPASIYAEFLSYIRTKYEGEYWHALPREIAAFWKEQHMLNSSSTPVTAGE
ncbi:MAG: hypothetical protein AB8G77_27645 [Rhodothermales bacterium]